MNFLFVMKNANLVRDHLNLNAPLAIVDYISKMEDAKIIVQKDIYQ